MMSASIVLGLSILLPIASCKPKEQPPAHKVGVVAPTGHTILFDPSTGNGLDAAVGEIVFRSGSLAAYVKYGPNKTDWRAFPGSASSTVTAGDGISVSVDGGVVTNTAPFGADTAVTTDASGRTVTELELIASLTTSTLNSEASDWTLKLLSGGSQVTALHLLPAQLALPNGTSSAPSFTFDAVKGGGMFWDSTFGVSFVASNPSNTMSFNGGTIRNSNGSGFVLIGTTDTTGLERNSSTDLRLRTDHDVVIGLDGALSTSATSGFIELPTCAGPPTGTVTVRSGKATAVIDTTNNKLCWSVGSGTWKCVTGT